MAKRGGGIDLSTLNVSKTPRTAREVADKKMRAELRGDAGSKKGGQERDEDLAEFYRKRAQERLEQAKAAKQKALLADPTRSLIECACGGPTRLEDLTFLIDKGMDLDDEWAGLSPLMHACAAGATAQPGVEALVRAGADVDMQNKASGITALMVAVNNNNATAVSFLLDHSGATPGLLDHSGHSALQCAYERGLAAVATKLVKALASPPAKVTTVAREKLLDARRKAAAAKRAEAAEKQAAMDKKIKAAMETE